MKIEELIKQVSSSGHYLVQLRCDECSVIFMSLKADRWWVSPYTHKCFDLSADLEISDERFLGGTIGNLVTVRSLNERLAE